MEAKNTLDYDALAKQMLEQWQMSAAQQLQQPAMMKAMLEAMAPMMQGGDHPAAAMMKQMQNAYAPNNGAQPADKGGAYGQSPAHPAADDAMDADELAWVKQRLAACEARIAMLEAKVD